MANFGIDLLLESQKANIKSNNDVLMIVMHWMLCKNEFRNVGVGENKIFSEEDRPSELLPEGWNDNEGIYILRYTLKKQIFLLYGNVAGESLVVNLLDAKTLKTAALTFDINKIVKSMKGSTLDDFVQDSELLIKRIRDEVLMPIQGQTPETRDAETSSANPLLVRPVVPPIPSYYEEPNPYFADPLRDIGRGDLDPFGRGGGMIFQPQLPRGPGVMGPFAPGRMPPGHPPGARYDPPNPFNRFGPDNDHQRPPGYDDMFM